MNWCFCGTSYGRYLPSTGCQTPCPGNVSEICGGSHANSVIALGSTAFLFLYRIYFIDLFSTCALQIVGLTAKVFVDQIVGLTAKVFVDQIVGLTAKVFVHMKLDTLKNLSL